MADDNNLILSDFSFIKLFDDNDTFQCDAWMYTDKSYPVYMMYDNNFNQKIKLRFNKPDIYILIL